MPTVGQNYIATVNVTILNEGGFTENVTVTIYANNITIGTQTYYNLAPESSATLIFIWDYRPCLWQLHIWAYADAVPGEGTQQTTPTLMA